MEGTTDQPKLWSSTQAYALAIICIFVGIAAGYMAHGPRSQTAGGSQASVPQQMPVTGTEQVSSDRLKLMADKKAEPLLAELKQNPKDASLLAKIGHVYLSAEQFATAKDYYERSVAVKPDPAALSALAFSYHRLGDTDKAIVTLNRALEIDPKNGLALYNLGMLQWLGKGDAKAATAAWKKFIQTHPDDPNRQQAEKMIARAKVHAEIPAGTKTDKPAM